MNIILYKTNSANNVINKTLTETTPYSIKLKDITNLTRPVIVLYDSKNTFFSHKFNYAYIQDFGRYYFIDDIKVGPNGMYTITLSCDVLESFKADILASKATIISSKSGSNYINEGYTKEVRKDVEYIDFKERPFRDFYSPNYVLITSKGRYSV